jgi:hypothetical protein
LSCAEAAPAKATSSVAAMATSVDEDFSDTLPIAPLIIDPLADHVPARCLERAVPGSG